MSVHGSIDAQGIYQYGGLDVLGPDWSAGFNLGMGSVSARLARFIGLKSSSQTVSTGGSPTALTSWDTALHTFAAFTFSASLGTWTCNTAGTYRAFAQVEFAAGATGTRTLQVQKALAASPTTFAAVLLGTRYETPANSGNVFSLDCTPAVACAAGDVLRVAVTHTQGANLVVNGAELDLALA